MLDLSFIILLAIIASLIILVFGTGFLIGWVIRNAIILRNKIGGRCE